jgi:hypothetical protein
MLPVLSVTYKGTGTQPHVHQLLHQNAFGISAKVLGSKEKYGRHRKVLLNYILQYLYDSNYIYFNVNNLEM